MNLPQKHLARATMIARAVVLLAFWGCFLAARPAVAGWAALSTTAPDNVQLMLLLPDGTVMAANAYTSGGSYGNAWYKLAPDSNGHYVNGTWTTRAPASFTRLWCSTDVLKNGKVFVAGGEYGTGGLTAELYDTVADSWSTITVPGGVIFTGPSGDSANSGFRDSMSTVLPNGRVMIAPVFPGTNNATVIYNPAANTLSLGPAYIQSQNEAGWVKLPDTSILTINKFNTTTERFIPALNKWIADASAPVNIYDAFGKETGPCFLLPNGKAIFFGGNGNTVLYTPSGTTNNGSWVQGPNIPSGRACPDAGGCMMPNGKILLAVQLAPFGNASSNIFIPPTYFYEYDYTVGATGSFTQVASPTGGFTDNIPSYKAIMLALPDGNVLYSDFSSQLYVYSPTSGPIAAGKPDIQTVSQNGDGSVHLTGTLFNGISEGASYGDDAQMASDYPLVRLTSGANVNYLRTFNWSGTTVMTGATVVSTDFDASGLFPGSYSIRVVANGHASDSVSYSGPVWVDFDFSFFFYFGTYDIPDNTLASAVTQVPSGGSIIIKSSDSAETMTISKPLTINSVGGPSVIGH